MIESDFANHGDVSAAISGCFRKKRKANALEMDDLEDIKVMEAIPRKEESKKFRDKMTLKDRWRSTKMEKAVSLAQERLGTNHGNILISSYSLVVLDILEIALTHNKILTIRYDGTTPPAGRASLEKEFQDHTIQKGPCLYNPLSERLVQISLPLQLLSL